MRIFNKYFAWFFAVSFFVTQARAEIDTNSNGVSDVWEREFNNGELFPALVLAADPEQGRLVGSVGKAIKVFKKGNGDEAIESIYQLSNKIQDFPGGKSRWWDPLLGDWRLLDFDNIYANSADAGAVLRARDLVQDAPLGNPVRGWSGKKLLSTFSNSNVTVFRTSEPMKAYRIYNGQGGAKSNFFSFEKPLSKSQVEADYALGNQIGPFQTYDRWTEVEIPSGEYVYMGYAAKQTDKYIGGGTQVWIEDDLVQRLDQEGLWNAWEAASKPLLQH